MPLRIPDAGRLMGSRWVAAKGVGKSTGIARQCVADFKRGRPFVLLDPVGGAIDNVLDTLLRQPVSQQRLDGKRLLYCDMGGTYGHVVSYPIYGRRGGEELFQTAERPLEIWKRADPALGSAPVQGLNAILNTGRLVGILCAALNWRITEVEALLAEPKRFERELRRVARTDPSVQTAVNWILTTLPKPTTNEYRNQTNSYLNKVRGLTLSDTTRAIYGATHPGIDWQQVVDEGRGVLIDFRGVRSDEHRTFGLLWVFHDLLDYIRERPSDSEMLPVVIDELSYFLSTDPRQQDVLAADFEELVARLSRNRRIALTVTHQELNQLTRRMHNVLMSMGTQVFGSTSDLASGAEVWAKRFDLYAPLAVKKATDVPFGRRDWITRTTELSIQEQLRIAAQEKYLSLPPFTFWAAVSPREGELGNVPMKFTLKPSPGGVRYDKISIVRERLATRDGKPVADVLKEISERLNPPSGEVFADDVPPTSKRILD